MTYRDTYQEPSDVMFKMADAVGLDDACIDCGYQFAYELEGCDACRPITVLLEAVGLSRKEET